MDRGLINLKTSGDVVAILYNLYDELSYSYEWTNPHELLLLSHIVEMRDKLGQMADRGQLKYTLTFCKTEMVAFVQLWENAIKPLPLYQAQIVQMIFNKLDRVSKEPAPALPVPRDRRQIKWN